MGRDRVIHGQKTVSIERQGGITGSVLCGKGEHTGGNASSRIFGVIPDMSFPFHVIISERFGS